MKKLCGLLFVLGTLSLHSAAPPEKGRELTAEEKKVVARMKQDLFLKIDAGEFEDVVKKAKQIADYRAERQGDSHWELIDARWYVKTWQRPAQQCVEVKRAFNIVSEGLQLQQNFRYREAEVKQLEALALRQKVLGEQFPVTAMSYHLVATCLLDQGKHAEALPLLQKALPIFQNTLGEQHPFTALSYYRVAFCLKAEGKHGEALPLFRKALLLRQNVFGEQHSDTAESYNSVACCLDAQGKRAEALLLHQKALAINQKVLGERHPQTAASYNNLALCLHGQGKYAEALLLSQKALAIRQTILGEQHPDTVESYNSVAACLNAHGKQAEALPMLQKVLALRQKLLGEDHPDTAAIYNNVAVCLLAQGKHAEALPLFQKALAISQKVLGEQHPDLATGYNNVAGCLDVQGKHAEALLLHQKALALRQKALGEHHPDTSHSYNQLASCLSNQRKYAEALPFLQKALAIHQKALGEQHPNTGAIYNNVAACLSAQGMYAEALPQYRKALAICQKVLGEQHPDTAAIYHGVGACLYNQYKFADATRYFEAALLGHEFGRLKAAASGFERSHFRADYFSPRAGLQICMVRLDKPLQAWEYAESDLARGLLDDLLRPSDTTADAGKLARLSQLDQALIPLLIREKPTAEETTQRDTLAKERDDLLADLARIAVRRSRERVLPLESIQKQIPPDAAVVFWLDASAQRLGCILRREGVPVWVKLRGSGKDYAWSDNDDTLPGLALAALSDGSSMPDARKKLLAQLHRQRIAPLEPHLKGVRQLLVVPSGEMSAVPVEALTDRYLVSYIPSASVYARAMEKHRALKASSLLVLADPIFTRTAPVLPTAPSHGLLVKAVTPGSAAARIGLMPGDVLLEYDGKKLTAADDLKPATGDDRVPVKLWRDGKALAGRVAAGNLGVVVDRRPTAEALADWRKQESSLLALGRGDDWQALPGTRLEARTLASLIPSAAMLLGRDAAEDKLDALAKSGKLKDYRLLHLATHGQANTVLPRQTALILSQDRLPTTAEAVALVLAGKKPPEGKLTVDTILKDWDIDADLVVLSACQSGLGKATSGDGMLGFTHALLHKGARSVVLSRWKVDDAATSLLMARFYENLLGKREGLKEAMKRAEALAEAKSWLRTLSRADAEKRLASLVDGVPRGERGSIKAALPTRKPDAPKDDRPFEHPYFWAAFVLIGDPN